MFEMIETGAFKDRNLKNIITSFKNASTASGLNANELAVRMTVTSAGTLAAGPQTIMGPLI